MDDLPRDPLTRGIVDIDGIKAHSYDDYISFELWSTLYIQQHSIKRNSIMLFEFSNS